MDLKTIFTKTAKGVTQVNQKTQSLSRDLMKVLKAIDGKSNVTALSAKAEDTKSKSPIKSPSISASCRLCSCTAMATAQPNPNAGCGVARQHGAARE